MKLLWAFGGVFATPGAVVIIEVLAHTGIRIPNPPAILILCVVSSAFRGGLFSGAISAGVAWLYIAYFFSIPAHPFQYTAENLARVAVWALTTPATALMVGILKRRGEDVTERKKTEIAIRERLELQEQLAKHAERLRILHEIDRALSAEQAPVAIAEAVVRPLRELLGAARVIVNLFDFAAGEVEWLAGVRSTLGKGSVFSATLPRIAGTRMI